MHARVSTRVAILSLIVAVLALGLQWFTNSSDRAAILLDMERVTFYYLKPPFAQSLTIGLGLMLTGKNTGRREVGLSEFTVEMRLALGNSAQVKASGFHVTDLASGDGNETLPTPGVTIGAGDSLRFHVSALLDLSDAEIDHFRQWIRQSPGHERTMEHRVEVVPLNEMPELSYTPVVSIHLLAKSGDGRTFVAEDFFKGRMLATAFASVDNTTLSDVWVKRTPNTHVRVYPFDLRMPGLQEPFESTSSDQSVKDQK